MRQWFVLSDVEPGTVLATWQRPFDLWGFTGGHRVLLFRSPREDWSDEEQHRDTRVDLIFKPIDALHVRTSYRTLTLRTATVARSREVLPWASGGSDDVRVVELIDADGSTDYIACLATGFHEDLGAGWEPSPFAESLSGERTPAWRRRMLGGGPDGDLNARFASLAELTTALTTAAPPTAAARGRFLYLSMMQISYAAAPPDDYAAAPPDDPEPPRASAVAAFLTRAEAEAHVAAESTRDDGYFVTERWVDVAPLDL